MSKTIPFEKKELIIIVHNPNNLPVIDFHELKELQGDLKITTPAKIEKLKNSIIKYGVFVPKFTWIDNGTHYIEDGHQTIKALTELEKGGYTVPPIPYVEIQAEDRKDAGEKLLMINSKFADINPETSFLTDFEIDLSFLEEIEMPELDLQSMAEFKKDTFDELLDEYGEEKRGVSHKNENWFYVEYYEDNDNFKELGELLKSHMKGISEHELDGSWFFTLIHKVKEAE